jgi:uncharacterized protein YgbK (DUF1537 family)
MGETSFARVGVLADDFSGAGDVALAFESVGLSTEIWAPTSGAHPRVSRAAVRVWIIDTESRGLSPQAADRAVREALGVLSDWKPDFIFKKIDSTLRGPVGAELAAFIEVLRPVGEIPFVAAFPKMGRTTVGGRHCVDGVPLHKTAFGRDPRHPVRSDRITEILQWGAPLTFQQQTNVPGGGARLSVKEQNLKMSNPLVVPRKNAATRESVWVPDVVNEQDMSAVARHALAGGRLAVGSAGFALAIARGLGARRQKRKTPVPVGFGPVGVVVGSAHPLSGLQMERLKRFLPRAGVYLLERPAARGSAGQVLRRLVEESCALETAHRIRRWVVTGGETAFALARFWNECRWRVVGTIERGIPLCRSVGRRPRFLVLKPGGFGSADALVKAVRFLLAEISPLASGDRRQRAEQASLALNTAPAYRSGKASR